MSKVFTPVVDADAVYGEGDWRPLLSEKLRKDTWKVHMIGKQSIDNKFRGVILPSFDWRLSVDDKALMTSVAPCWTSTPDPRLPRHFTPNAFAIPLLMYPFLGERKEHWLSPGNLRNMLGNDVMEPDAAADAFDDLNKWIRRNKSFDDAKKDFYLKAPTMREDPLVPGRSIRYVSLCWGKDKEQDWHPSLVGYTSSSYSYVIEQMRWAYRSEDGPPRDPNWPQYMLGDPTDPAAALEFHVDKMKIDAKDPYETNVLCFTERAEFLDDRQNTLRLTKEMLDKRFAMVDPANWNIPTYEEQVDHMIRHYDPNVTIDMIRAACAHRFRGEIPRQRPESVRLNASAPADEPAPTRRQAPRREEEDAGDPLAAVTGGASRFGPKSDPPMPTRSEAPRSESPAPRSESPAPRSESPAPRAAAAPKASPADDLTYWVGRTGEKPVKLRVADMQRMADAGDFDGVKVMTGPNQWLPLISCGLVQVAPAEEAPPEVPADDAPPEVPADDVPPDVPGDAPTDGAISLSEMKLRLFNDTTTYNELSADNKKLADELIDRAWQLTDHGRKKELPPEVVDRLIQIL